MHLRSRLRTSQAKAGNDSVRVVATIILAEQLSVSRQQVRLTDSLKVPSLPLENVHACPLSLSPIVTDITQDMMAFSADLAFLLPRTDRLPMRLFPRH